MKDRVDRIANTIFVGVLITSVLILLTGITILAIKRATDTRITCPTCDGAGLVEKESDRT